MPHYEAALITARWLTRNRSDAEDVVQEALLKAFRSIHQCANANGRAWLLAIVRNTAYDWLKKNRSSLFVLVEDLNEVQREKVERGGDSVDATVTSPEAHLIRSLDEGRLEAAIRKLPEQFRETLVLRDIQGLEYSEIAEVTGAPVGTVMSRLARARERLVELVRSES